MGAISIVSDGITAYSENLGLWLSTGDYVSMYRTGRQATTEYRVG